MAESEKVLMTPRRRLDPDWKRKVTQCLTEVGIIDAAQVNVTLHVSDFHVSSMRKEEVVK